MSFLCWTPSLSGAEHTGRSFNQLVWTCERRRGDTLHTFRSNAAPYTHEKVVAISVGGEQWRYRTENVKTKKQGIQPYEETVSSALGWRLDFSTRVEENVKSNCGSWIRGGLGRDVINPQVELNSAEVQEDEFPHDESKFRDDVRTGEASTCEHWETKRHAGRVFSKRAAILGAVSAVFSGVNCLCCSTALAVGSGSQWEYGVPSGVAKWEGLCASGPKQSPIDISLSKVKSGESLGELQFEYAASCPTIVNPGHGTMQVSFAQGKNILRVGSRTLELLQFHFHAPSEHAFDGERFAMEAHLVHRDMKTRKLAVVGIMLKANKFTLPNKGLAESLANSPVEHGQSIHVHDVTFSPSLLLPPVTKNEKREYLHYVGSLSTPPCSEGVDWFILGKFLEIPTSQVLDFLRFAGDGRSFAFNSRKLHSHSAFDVPSAFYSFPRVLFKGSIFSPVHNLSEM